MLLSTMAALEYMLGGERIARCDQRSQSGVTSFGRARTPQLLQSSPAVVSQHCCAPHTHPSPIRRWRPVVVNNGSTCCCQQWGHDVQAILVFLRYHALRYIRHVAIPHLLSSCFVYCCIVSRRYPATHDIYAYAHRSSLCIYDLIFPLLLMSRADTPLPYKKGAASCCQQWQHVLLPTMGAHVAVNNGSTGIHARRGADCTL